MRKIEYEYGCFRCGAVRPKCRASPHTDGIVVCGECGEPGVVTFQQALDLINNFYLARKDDVEELITYDEYYGEFDYAEEGS